jgi:hypothetical protein
MGSLGRSATEQAPGKGWVKKRVRPATLNDSTTPDASGFLAGVRKTLSFSKSLANPIGAIWYFIHHYNASLLV